MKELYDFTAILKHETPKAILISTDGKNEVWIPKSVAEYELNSDKRTYTVTVPQRWAEEKGII